MNTLRVIGTILCIGLVILVLQTIYSVLLCSSKTIRKYYLPSVSSSNSFKQSVRSAEILSIKTTLLFAGSLGLYVPITAIQDAHELFPILEPTLVYSPGILYILGHITITIHHFLQYNTVEDIKESHSYGRLILILTEIVRVIPLIILYEISVAVTLLSINGFYIP
jgi:hypothetical protein